MISSSVFLVAMRFIFNVSTGTFYQVENVGLTPQLQKFSAPNLSLSDKFRHSCPNENFSNANAFIAEYSPH